MNINNNIQKTFSQVPGWIYLAVAVLIFAASNSFTRIIIDIGQHNLIDGRNPISLCNVLFVGNICAFGVMVLIFYKDLKLSTLKALTRKDWINLTITSVLSGAIAPALTFTAIGHANIANVVLIGRIEPFLTLMLSIWLFGLRVDGWTLSGSLVSLGGVATTIILGGAGNAMKMGGLQIGTGEILVAIAAIITSISTVNTKLQLQEIPVGFFSIYRNAVGTMLFFLLANILYGPMHFVDILSPLLWQWMIIYAIFIVVVARVSWLVGLKLSTSTEINLAALVNPVLTICLAYLILGQVPTQAQFWGVSLLIIGLILSFIGNLNQDRAKRIKDRPTTLEKMEMPIGFRGV
ncbi:MAG: EamA family transporter [Pseudanabaena frigida]|uniref:EamA family transporter n=1 Tax=Pseudanabaena frigida TaxID=945775 RepID=A0A2W4WQV0_9CYAN|nr:MAG: EamA family transporter [Pseudanabaena frigida]